MAGGSTSGLQSRLETRGERVRGPPSAAVERESQDRVRTYLGRVSSVVDVYALVTRDREIGTSKKNVYRKA